MWLSLCQLPLHHHHQSISSSRADPKSINLTRAGLGGTEAQGAHGVWGDVDISATTLR